MTKLQGWILIAVVVVGLISIGFVVCRFDANFYQKTEHMKSELMGTGGYDRQCVLFVKDQNKVCTDAKAKYGTDPSTGVQCKIKTVAEVCTPQ